MTRHRCPLPRPLYAPHFDSTGIVECNFEGVPSTNARRRERFGAPRFDWARRMQRMPGEPAPGVLTRCVGAARHALEMDDRPVTLTTLLGSPRRVAILRELLRDPGLSLTDLAHRARI